MPEGPEVRHNAELLGRLLCDVRVADIIAVPGGKLARKGLPGLDRFEPGLVDDVSAKGKLIVVSFANGAALTSSLGMSGWWYPGTLAGSAKLYGEKAYQQGKLVLAESVIKQAYKYSRVLVIDEDGAPIATFSDMRNFGNMEYYRDGLSEDKLNERIGLDLLNELPSIASDMARYQLLTMKHHAPKRLQRMKLGDLALEQSFIAGLGNIYRAEALWLSDLDPYRTLDQLSDDEWLKFCEVAMTVLQIAYRTAGTMHYPAALIAECTGVADPQLRDRRGHLAYGQQQDVFGRAIVRDDKFDRPLWRLS